MIAYNDILLQDVFLHLAKLKSDFATLKIEFSKNDLLVFAMNDYDKKIELIEQIIKSYDNLNFKNLTNEINKVLIKDEELHRINVIIEKSNFSSSIDKSKTALITHRI